MKDKFSKIYFEITNVCNADCKFCPKTKREKRFVTEAEFDTVLTKIKGRAEYLYFHLMGEPLLHPLVSDFAEKASSCGFKVMITTNGLLSGSRGKELIEKGNIFKISISLHSFEANNYGMTINEYLENCFSLASLASGKGTIAVLRLWNSDFRENNAEHKPFSERVLAFARDYFRCELTRSRNGFKVKDRIFFEFGDRFDWPDKKADVKNENVFCHALRLQFGILSDGTVVPCCLDSEGTMALGNIFESDIDKILSSERARDIYDGFTARTPSEELCKTCGFASRFNI